MQRKLVGLFFFIAILVDVTRSRTVDEITREMYYSHSFGSGGSHWIKVITLVTLYHFLFHFKYSPGIRHMEHTPCAGLECMQISRARARSNTQRWNNKSSDIFLRCICRVPLSPVRFCRFSISAGCVRSPAGRYTEYCVSKRHWTNAVDITENYPWIHCKICGSALLFILHRNRNNIFAWYSISWAIQRLNLCHVCERRRCAAPNMHYRQLKSN